MKKKLLFPLIGFVLLFLMSCGDDSELEKFELEGTFVPQLTLSSASVAVFEDIQDNLKEFVITHSEEELKKSDNGEKYLTDEISFDLNNDSETYHLNIKLTGERIDNIFRETVTARLFTRIGFIEIPTITINEEGNPVLCEKLGSLMLNNKSFHGVFRNFENENIPFKYIYYNQELGIVGFHDDGGKLWTLKNYK